MKLEITPTKERSHHYRGCWVRGATKDVWEEVNKKFQEYVCPMYEHMAWKVVEIDTTDLPYRLGVRLFKNDYAGD